MIKIGLEREDVMKQFQLIVTVPVPELGKSSVKLKKKISSWKYLGMTHTVSWPLHVVFTPSALAKYVCPEYYVAHKLHATYIDVYIIHLVSYNTYRCVIHTDVSVYMQSLTDLQMCRSALKIFPVIFLIIRLNLIFLSSTVACLYMYSVSLL